MAATAFYYGKFFDSVFKKKADLSADTLKVMLCTSSYTPDQDAHDFKDDITNEVTGTGYTAGGATLANVTLTYTAGTNVMKLDADDVSWTSSSITARYAVIYDDTPATAATKPLIGYIDFGQNETSASGTLTIAFNASGIGTVTVS